MMVNPKIVKEKPEAQEAPFWVPQWTRTMFLFLVELRGGKGARDRMEKRLEVYDEAERGREQDV